jgi:hypothetical protein
MTAYAVHYTIAGQIATDIRGRYPNRQVTFSEPDAEEQTTVTFTPDFTGADLAAVDNYVSKQRANAPLDDSRAAAIRAEVPTLQAYLDASAPTATQTVTATKALIRVVRALVAQ